MRSYSTNKTQFNQQSLDKKRLLALTKSDMIDDELKEEIK